MADRYWWVNQSKTYEQERQLGLLWSPLRSANGNRVSHWESMIRVLPGDIIVHYGNSHIRGLSRAQSTATDSARPFTDESWEQEGHSIRVAFEELDQPVHREEIPLALRTAGPYKNSPFDKTGQVNQGYLYDLAPGIGAAIVDIVEGAEPRQSLTPTVGPIDIGGLAGSGARVIEWTAPAYDPLVVHTRSSVDDLASDRERVVTFEEFRLQSQFGDWLLASGTRPKQLQIPIGGSFIQPDFYVPARGWIVEAKKSAARPYVRLAIGQVLDYVQAAQAHGIDAAPVILLPRRPEQDLVNLIRDLGIALTVPAPGGFEVLGPRA